MRSMPLVENNTQVNENKFKDKNKRRLRLSETYLLKMIPAVFHLSASTRSCEAAHLAEDLASMTILPLMLPPVSSPVMLHYLCVCVCVCVCVCARAHARTQARAQSLQSCLTLCNLVACSPPGSSVLGILQARILEWVAVSSSKESSQPKDQT